MKTSPSPTLIAWAALLIARAAAAQAIAGQATDLDWQPGKGSAIPAMLRLSSLAYGATRMTFESVPSIPERSTTARSGGKVVLVSRLRAPTVSPDRCPGCFDDPRLTERAVQV